MDKISVAFQLREPKAKTETPIQCHITINGKRLVYPTHYKVSPKDWTKKLADKKSGKWFLPSITYYRNRNQELSEMKLEIEDLFNQELRENGKALSKTDFKERLDIRFNRTEKPETTTLLAFIERFIQARKRQRITEGKRVTGNTILSSYNQTRNKLINFSKHTRNGVDFEDVSIDWYDNFVDYLQYECDLKKNTIGTHIKNIKVFMNDALEKNLTTNRAHLSKHFKKVVEESYEIALTDEELNEIFKLDLSQNPYMERSRDLLIVLCSTALRYSDLNKLNRSSILERNGTKYIQIKTQKTSTVVPLPIDFRLKHIMDKYKDSDTGFPKVISNQKLNQAIKKIGQQVKSLHSIEMYNETKGGKRIQVNKKRYELLSTHTGRRTFATRWYLSGKLSVQSIMTVTGHKTEQAFFKYIRMTPSDVILDFEKAMQSESPLSIAN